MLKDLYDYLYLQNETGGIPLKSTGIAVALGLLASHLVALRKGTQVQSFLKAFPRDYKWGAILLTIDFIWGMMCLANMDMGEFYTMRGWFLYLVPVGFVAVLVFVKEFLAVRALGALLLLVAGIVLEAAYLKPQTSRLLLPIIAYVWVIAGLYFVGMPYLMRDWITWITAKPQRWKLATIGGLAYGAVLLVVAIADY